MLRMMLSLSKPLRVSLEKIFQRYSNRAKREYLNNNFISEEYYDDFYRDVSQAMNKNVRLTVTAISNKMKQEEGLKQEEIIIEQDGRFVPISPIVRAYINSTTAEKVTRVTQTTKKKIQRVIEKSLDDRLSEIDTADAISSSTAFSRTRAKVIARTETHSALSYGQHEVARNLFLKGKKKSWLSANDDRTRDWHKVMNTRPPIPYDEDFIIYTPVAGGGVAEIPMEYTGDTKGGALNVINCRCQTLYFDVDTIVED